MSRIIVALFFVFLISSCGGGGGGDDRRSGARGWEDRSYGARDNASGGADSNPYEDGRSRRRRGSSTSGGDDYSGYGGAEG